MRSYRVSIREGTRCGRGRTLERFPFELVDDHELESPVEHAGFLEPEEIGRRSLILEIESSQKNKGEKQHGRDGVCEDEVSGESRNEVSERDSCMRIRLGFLLALVTRSRIPMYAKYRWGAGSSPMME